MKILNLKSILGIVALVVLLGSCDKTKLYENTLPPAQAHFVGDENQTYSVTGSPAPTYNVVIGTTDVASVDRVINYEVTSPTGAVAGTQYTIGTTGSVTIPAGQTIATIDVHGDVSAYTAGRKDLLVFSLKPGSVENATFSDTVKLLMRGPCFDGDIENISDMAGSFTKTFENGSYGPYTTTIGSVTPTSATTASAKLTNLYESFGPVTINLDWTDPNNTKAEIPLQITDKLYAAGQPFYVRTTPGSANNFSICNQRFSFILDVLVNIGGTLYYYDREVVYTMGR